MTTLNKLSDSVRDSLDALAEGWQDLWNRARHAITRFTPSSDDEAISSNRWGLLSAELHEGTDDICVEIEAPGLKKEDFEIFVDGQILVIRGTKQSSRERTEGHYHISERAYGKFERQLPLPVEVDEASTKASYRNGVLSVTMPKSKAEMPRVIRIN
ncbi:MAG: Hsp20/alpha crystallin family protein [Gammaproteobacteria bacterium]|jgi:HSP20 family protein|nr:Hsp20/alpha crystallin family protein [Gammaproteobacteria bacterium]MBT7372295.1 Hsp20/alpha crystallin family protein [Gammaproteobacteria bacterium]